MCPKRKSPRALTMCVSRWRMTRGARERPCKRGSSGRDAVREKGFHHSQRILRRLFSLQAADQRIDVLCACANVLERFQFGIAWRIAGWVFELGLGETFARLDVGVGVWEGVGNLH